MLWHAALRGSLSLFAHLQTMMTTQCSSWAILVPQISWKQWTQPLQSICILMQHYDLISMRFMTRVREGTEKFQNADSRPA